MLRNAPMFGYGLFPDAVLNTAEQDINKYKSAGVGPGPGPGASQRSNWRGNFRYKPYDKRGHQRGSQQHEQEQQPWGQFSRSANGVEAEVEVTLVFLNLEASKHINDNYSVTTPLVNHSCPGLFSVKQQSHQEQNISCLNSKQSVSCINVVSPVLSATIPGQPQKKGLRPVQNMKSIKLVKGVSCVVLSHFAPSVQSVPHVVTKTSVGGRLQSFWQVWQKLGSNPRVVSLLRDGYSLPFRERPHLSRFPFIVSKYASPSKSKALIEALWSKASSGKGGNQVLAGFLQPPIPSPKTQRTMASDLGPKPTQPVPVNGHFQDGNSGDNPVITSARGMGHFAGLQRCLLPHPHCSEIQKVSGVPHEQGQLPLHLPSLWSSNCPVGIHQGGQGGQTNGSSKGYQDPPVPRRLVATSPFPGNLPTAYPDPLGPMSRTGLAGKHAKVRTGAPTGFQLRRLLVRPVDRSGLAHSGPASQSKREAPVHQGSGLLYCSSVHVPDRSSDCDRKASVCWSAPYEANSVAPETSLACARTSGEGNSGPQVSPS